MQGEESSKIEAIQTLQLDAAQLDDAHRRMLDFVKLITQAAYKTTDEDIQRLREAQWTDEQIGEMVYITALFALLNRVADAFGIVAPIMEDMSGSHSGEPA